MVSHSMNYVNFMELRGYKPYLKRAWSDFITTDGEWKGLLER